MYKIRNVNIWKYSKIRIIVDKSRHNYDGLNRMKGTRSAEIVQEIGTDKKQRRERPRYTWQSNIARTWEKKRHNWWKWQNTKRSGENTLS